MFFCWGAFFVCLALVSLIVGVVCVVATSDDNIKDWVGWLGVGFLIVASVFVALSRGHVHGDYYRLRMSEYEIEKAIDKHYHRPSGECCDDQ